MDAELIMGAVAYWLGFSLMASVHFFVKQFKKLQSTIVMRLLGFVLMMLLLTGALGAAFFGGYVNHNFPANDIFAKGLWAGFTIYGLFAWLWTSYVT